ncbi:MAG: hypothetical protein J6K73_07555 [Clostridia bacterium]|nr:hypothetical protein [Clostridia bacterium]
MKRIISFYVDLIDEYKDQKFRFFLWMVLCVLPWFCFLIKPIDEESRLWLVPVSLYFLITIPIAIINNALIYIDTNFDKRFHSILWRATLIVTLIYIFFAPIAMEHFYTANKLIFNILLAIPIVLYTLNLFVNIIQVGLLKGILIFLLQIIYIASLPYYWYTWVAKQVCCVHDDLEAYRAMEAKHLHEQALREEREKENHEFWSGFWGGRAKDFNEHRQDISSIFDFGFDQEFSVNGHTYQSHDAGNTWTDEYGNRFDSNGDPTV